MEKINQKILNKILVGILIVLVVFIGYSRFTEQKRVEYYICYDWYSGGMNEEEVIDFCTEKVYERND